MEEATDAKKAAQFLSIVNTLLSLLGAGLSVFATSALVGGRFNMVHIQNSTLAGGVAMGAACTLRLTPGGALAVGLGAGAISTLGFQYLMPFLDRTIGLGDTCGEAVISFVCAHNSTPLSRPAITDCCALPLPASTLSPHPGVHNLHGIPAIVGTLVAGLAALGQHPDYLEHDTGRQQLGYQVLAGVVTMGIAIAGGLLGGFVVSWFNPRGDDPLTVPEVRNGGPEALPFACLFRLRAAFGCTFLRPSCCSHVFCPFSCTPVCSCSTMGPGGSTSAWSPCPSPPPSTSAT